MLELWDKTQLGTKVAPIVLPDFWHFLCLLCSLMIYEVMFWLLYSCRFTLLMALLWLPRCHSGPYST